MNCLLTSQPLPLHESYDSKRETPIRTNIKPIESMKHDHTEKPRLSETPFNENSLLTELFFRPNPISITLMKPHLTEKPLISEKIYINLLGPTTSLMRGFSVLFQCLFIKYLG